MRHLASSVVVAVAVLVGAAMKGDDAARLAPLASLTVMVLTRCALATLATGIVCAASSRALLGL